MICHTCKIRLGYINLYGPFMPNFRSQLISYRLAESSLELRTRIFCKSFEWNCLINHIFVFWSAIIKGTHIFDTCFQRQNSKESQDGGLENLLKIKDKLKSQLRVSEYSLVSTSAGCVLFVYFLGSTDYILSDFRKRA